ncbi:ribonuclease J [Lujinxingia vulgaris]|uniref:Ribonuclease J n=1 Tax=Lujinxingia vulgaris TaxID=2600176 RepID=A0A5C6XGB1_9DELT|nr:ribonuclease J [Lujinxingia vulgaris]TXD38453.1 ribonuclease J [Lujinxingia vulgaris]
MSENNLLPAPPKKDYLRYIPLGGLDEVGMNCSIIECNGSMLMIDCGITFPETGDFGVDIVLPDWSYVLDNLDKLDGILLTHGHEDHIGGAPFFLQEVDVPVYSGRLTLGMLNRKLQSHGLGNQVDLIEVEPGEQLEIGPFVAEFVHINHSVPNAMAIALHTPMGTALFTGDWKIDQTPMYEPMTDLPRLAALGDQGVLALFGDSTNSEVPGFTRSERAVFQGFSEVFENAPGRLIVAQFSSNLHRVAGLLELAYRHKRKAVLMGTSLVKNSNIARDLGFLPFPPEDVLINPEEMDKYPDKRILIISTGSQAEPRSSLARMAFGDHRHVEVQEGDTIVLSARQIPGNEYGINSMVNALYKRGATIITADDKVIHGSGHAKQEELKLMLNLTRPTHLIPVHGEYRMRKGHARLGSEVGVENTHLIENGDCLQITDKGAEVIGRVHHGRMLVDGRNVGDTEDFQLRDRRKLASAGIVMAMGILDRESGSLVAPPTVLQRGVVNTTESDELLEQAAQAAWNGVQELSRAARGDISEVKEAIRTHIRRYISKELGRRPVVIPVVHEL